MRFEHESSALPARNDPGGPSSPDGGKASGVARPARLTPGDEQRLLDRVFEGDEMALAELVRRHEPLVRKLVWPFRFRELPLEDLLQTGRAALVEAIRRYTPGQRTRLGTFAYKRIHGALSDAVRNAGRAYRLGDEFARDVARIAAHEERLAQRLGRWPTWEEVGDDLGIPHERMAELVPHTTWPVSLTELSVATSEAENGADGRNSLDDPELELEREAAASALEELEAGADVGVEAHLSGSYTGGEIRALLKQYADTRAGRETGADSLIERGTRRVVGNGMAARLADIDRALERLPTELFVVVELHGIKQLSLREQARFTAIPHTTAHDRFQRALAWIAGYLNGEAHSHARVLRMPFWNADLATELMAATPIEFELWARRGQASVLFDGKGTHRVSERDTGEGWLLPPHVTGFSEHAPEETLASAHTRRPARAAD